MFREVLVKCWNIPGDAIACLDAWKAMFEVKQSYQVFEKSIEELGLDPYQQEVSKRFNRYDASKLSQKQL